MTQSDANCSPSTCQPVDTLAAVDKAAVDADVATIRCKSRTMFLGGNAGIGRGIFCVSYLVAAFRRFDSRHDARLPQPLQK